MDLYTFISVVLLPITIFHFSLDYLSDSEITKSEVKIGISQYIHYFFGTMCYSGIAILPFLNPTLGLILLNITVSIVAQIGWLKNKEYCWLWSYTNKLINPNKPKRKWLSNIILQIKKYIRGDSWAYSEVKSVDNTKTVLAMTITQLFILIKYLYKYK
jgi:hypothetical protein